MGSAITGFGILSVQEASQPQSQGPDVCPTSLLEPSSACPFLPAWFALVVSFIALMIERYTAIGRHVNATGESESMVRASGVDVE